MDQIALILKISPRTVQEHIDILKEKFCTQNRFELVDKAVDSVYLSLIPQSLFNSQLSVILNE